MDREEELLKQLDDTILLHGENHRSVSDIYYDLADLCHRRGDVVRAKELFQKCYDIRLSQIGEGYEDTIDAYYRLSFLLDAEDPDDSVAMTERRRYLLELREAFDEGTSPRLKITDTSAGQLFFDSTLIYNDIAEDWRAAGNFENADAYYVRCIELRRSKYGQYSAAVSPVLLNYAQSLQSQERLPETEIILKEALDINTRAYGAFHGTVAEVLNKLGLVYVRMQRYDEAEVTLRESLRLRQALFGDLNIIVASSLNNLAELYREKRDYLTAINFHNLAIDAYVQSVGADHPGTINARGNLGVTYRRQAREGFEKGGSLVKEAVTYLQEHGYDSGHPWVVKFDIEDSLAEMQALVDEGEFDGALRIAEALDAGQSTRGVAVSVTWLSPGQRVIIVECRVRSVLGKAKALLEGGRLRDAEALLAKAMGDVITKHVSPENPLYAQALKLVGDVCAFKAEFGPAKEHYLRAMQLVTDFIGPESVLLADTMIALADLSRAQALYAEAEALYTQSMQILVADISRDPSPTPKPNAEAPALYAKALLGVSELFLVRNAFESATSTLAQCKLVCNGMTGPRLVHQARLLELQGAMAAERGDIEEAQELYEQAVSTLDSAFVYPAQHEVDNAFNVRRHPHVGVVLLRQAQLALVRPELDRCQSLLDQAESALVAHFEVRHEPRIVLAYLRHVCDDLAGQRYEESKARLVEVLNICRKLYGGRHPLVGSCMCSIADNLLARGDAHEAQLLYEDAKKIFQELFDADGWNHHKSIAKCLLGLARCALCVGMSSEAVPIVTECLAINKHLCAQLQLGTSDPNTPTFTLEYAEVQCVWAEVCVRACRIKDCKQLLTAATEVAFSKLGQKSSLVSELLLVCAKCLCLEGLHKDARTCLSYCMSIRISLYGLNHLQVFKTLAQAAENIRQAGYLADAQAALNVCLRGFTRLLGQQHQQPSSEGVPNEESAAGAAEEKKTPPTPAPQCVHVFEVQLIKARTLCNLRKYGDAEILFREVGAHIKAWCGEVNELYLEVTVGLAECARCQHTQKMAHAVSKYKEALQLLGVLFGQGQSQSQSQSQTNTAIVHVMELDIRSAQTMLTFLAQPKKNRTECLQTLMNDIIPSYTNTLGASHVKTLFAKGRLGYLMDDKEPGDGDRLRNRMSVYFGGPSFTPENTEPQPADSSQPTPAAATASVTGTNKSRHTKHGGQTSQPLQTSASAVSADATLVFNNQLLYPSDHHLVLELDGYLHNKSRFGHLQLHTSATTVQPALDPWCVMQYKFMVSSVQLHTIFVDSLVSAALRGKLDTFSHSQAQPLAVATVEPNYRAVYLRVLDPDYIERPVAEMEVEAVETAAAVAEETAASVNEDAIPKLTAADSVKSLESLPRVEDSIVDSTVTAEEAQEVKEAEQEQVQVKEFVISTDVDISCTEDAWKAALMCVPDCDVSAAEYAVVQAIMSHLWDVAKLVTEPENEIKEIEPQQETIVSVVAEVEQESTPQLASESVPTVVAGENVKLQPEPQPEPQEQVVVKEEQEEVPKFEKFVPLVVARASTQVETPEQQRESEIPMDDQEDSSGAVSHLPPSDQNDLYAASFMFTRATTLITEQFGFKKALPLLEECVTVRERLLPNTQLCVDTKFALAKCCYKLFMWETCAELFNDCVREQRQLWAAAHASESEVDAACSTKAQEDEEDEDDLDKPLPIKSNKAAAPAPAPLPPKVEKPKPAATLEEETSRSHSEVLCVRYQIGLIKAFMTEGKYYAADDLLTEVIDTLTQAQAHLEAVAQALQAVALSHTPAQHREYKALQSLTLTLLPCVFNLAARNYVQIDALDKAEAAMRRCETSTLALSKLPSHTKGLEQSVAQLCTARYYIQTRNLSEAKPLIEQALIARKNKLAPPNPANPNPDIVHPKMAECLVAFGECLYAQGMFADADIKFALALDMYTHEAVEGADALKASKPNPEVVEPPPVPTSPTKSSSNAASAKASNNKQQLKQETKQPVASKATAAQSPTKRKQAAPVRIDDDLLVARILLLRAHILYRQGLYSQAICTYKHVAHLRARIFGEQGLAVTDCMLGVAACLYEMCEYLEARDLVTSCIDLRSHWLRPGTTPTADSPVVTGTASKPISHSVVAEAALLLANIERKLCNYSTARSLFNNVNECYLAVFGKHSHVQIKCEEGLAELHADTQAYDTALRMFGQVLTVKKQLFGDDHVEYAQTLDAYGNCLRAYRPPNPAQLALTSLTDNESSLEGGAPNAGGSGPIGSSLNSMNRKMDQALAMLDEALKIRRLVLQPNHAHIAHTLSNIGLTLCAKAAIASKLGLFKPTVRVISEEHVVSVIDGDGNESEMQEGSHVLSPSGGVSAQQSVVEAEGSQASGNASVKSLKPEQDAATGPDYFFVAYDTDDLPVFPDLIFNTARSRFNDALDILYNTFMPQAPTDSDSVGSASLLGGGAGAGSLGHGNITIKNVLIVNVEGNVGICNKTEHLVKEQFLSELPKDERKAMQARDLRRQLELGDEHVPDDSAVRTHPGVAEIELAIAELGDSENVFNEERDEPPPEGHVHVPLPPHQRSYKHPWLQKFHSSLADMDDSQKQVETDASKQMCLDADNLRKQRLFDEADAMFDESLFVILEGVGTVGASGSIKAAEVVLGKADIARELGRHRIARKCYHLCMSILRRAGEPVCAMAACVYFGLAELFRLERRSEEALPLYTQALGIQRQLLNLQTSGPQTQSTLMTFKVGQARAQLELCSMAEAEESLHQVLKYRQQVLAEAQTQLAHQQQINGVPQGQDREREGNSHASTKYASTRGAQSTTNNASTPSVSLAQQRINDLIEQVVEAHTLLARVNVLKGDFNNALTHLDSGLQMIRGSFGGADDHVACAELFLVRAEYKLALGKYFDARKEVGKALHLRIKHFGNNAKALKTSVTMKTNEATASAISFLHVLDEILADERENERRKASSHLVPMDFWEEFEANNSPDMQEGDAVGPLSPADISNAKGDAITGNTPRSAKSAANSTNNSVVNDDHSVTSDNSNGYLSANPEPKKFNYDVEVDPNTLFQFKKMPVTDHAYIIECLQARGEICYLLGDYEESKELLDGCITMSINMLGPSSVPHARALVFEGLIIYQLHSLADAVLALTRARTMQLQLLSDLHPDRCLSAQALAHVKCVLCKFDECADLLQQCVTADGRYFGVDSNHYRTIEVLVALADCKRLKGELTESHALLNRCLLLCKHTYAHTHGEVHPVLATVLQALGECSMDMCVFDGALALFEQAHSVRSVCMGDDHPNTMQSLSSCGRVNERLGRYGQFKKTTEECFAMQKKRLGKGHRDTVITLFLLGQAYLCSCKYHVCLPILERVCAELPRHFGNDHSLCASVSECLGVYYFQAAADYKKAKEFHMHALKTRRRVFGEKHSSVASSIHALGQIEMAEGLVEDGIKHFDDALAIRRLVLGSSTHTDMAQSFHGVAIGLVHRSRYSDALQLFQRAHTLQVQTLGSGHAQTLLTLIDMSVTLRTIGQLEQAAANFQRYLPLLIDCFGSVHPTIALTMCLLGETHTQMGNLEDGRRYLSDALEMRRFLFEHTNINPSHPDICASMICLADNLRARGVLALGVGVGAEEEGSATQRNSPTQQGGAPSSSSKSRGRSPKTDAANDALVLSNLDLDNDAVSVGSEGTHTSHSSTAISRLEAVDPDSQQRLANRDDELFALPVYEKALDLATMTYGDEHSEIIRIWFGQAETLKMLGRYKEATNKFKKAMLLARRVCGDDHPFTIEAFAGLAEILRVTSKIFADENEFEEASAYKSLGPSLSDHLAAALNIPTRGLKSHWAPTETVAVSKTHNTRNISALPQALKKRKNYNAEGGYMGYCFPEPKKISSTTTRSVAQPTKIQANDAKWLYEYAISLFRKLFGEAQAQLQHPLYATLLFGKGELMRARRKSDQALQCLESSLEIRRKLFHGTHPSIADCLNSIAEVYRGDNRFEKATPVYDIALEMRLKAFGPTHFLVAEVKNNMGIMAFTQGRYEVAEGLYTEGLNMRINSLGTDHPAVAQSLNNLAALLHAVGRLAEAQPLYERALEIKKKVFGERHPDYAQALNNLGLLLKALGQLDDAMLMQQTAYDIQTNTFGPLHPDVATSLHNLASVYAVKGMRVKARDTYREAVDVKRKLFGLDHPSVASSLNNLGGLLLSMNEVEEAKTCYEESLRVRRKVFGETHPATAESLNNIGLLLYSQRRYVDAQPLLDKSLRIKRVVFGSQHALVALALHNYAVLLHKMGRLDEARAAYTEAVSTRSQLFGDAHPATQESLRNLQLLNKAIDVQNRSKAGGGSQGRPNKREDDDISEDEGLSVGTDYHEL